MNNNNKASICVYHHLKDKHLWDNLLVVSSKFYHLNQRFLEDEKPFKSSDKNWKNSLSRTINRSNLIKFHPTKLLLQIHLIHLFSPKNNYCCLVIKRHHKKFWVKVVALNIKDKGCKCYILNSQLFKSRSDKIVPL